MKSPTLVSLEGDIAGEETAEWEKFCQVVAMVHVGGGKAVSV